MTANQIQDQLIELIRAKTGVTAQPDDTIDTLKIDSLAMAELTVEIERDFDIRVDEQVMDVQSIRELVAYIATRTA